ncbi:F-box/LRR-repeat protein At1g55660-like [Papaver somniferum]|uniref:F-box/LRR-repeat protein At1g55660-like n=1 Tax=Papaver somniferum TaxID=3469 RepID=UPI000E6FB6AE|nr:F-box/LRR-repeat protein At1g55660-like [Papaver somniferum]
MVETKKLRTSSRNEEKEVDRIIKLQDELIHHIMSFMDTQRAVQTSVLSKRWIDIWKSLPCLRFRTCSFESEFKRVNKWIDAVVRRNVQDVTIKLATYSFDDNDLTYEVPPKLLKCKSLKKLTLRKLGGQCVFIIVPKSISLPQLNYMCLNGCLMSDVESSKRLFSSCPVLETLNIVDCYIKTNNQRNFALESLSLKKFAYTNQTGFKQSIIKLSAPNLNNFSCESFWTKDYHLLNCSDQLSDVKFNILYYYTYENQQLEEKQVCGRRMVKLLAAVDKVKQLELSSGFLELQYLLREFSTVCEGSLECYRLGTLSTSLLISSSIFETANVVY